jgi:hypothetical protein
MKRLLIVAAVTAASCAAAVPAFAGLSNNPSFSHRIPVTVPSQAQLVHFDDHGRALDDSPTATVPRARTSTPKPTHSEAPGDRRGDPTRVEPGDDRGTETEPDDDRGTVTEPGDDRGTVTDSGDDNDGRHGSGSGRGGPGSGGSDDGRGHE